MPRKKPGERLIERLRGLGVDIPRTAEVRRTRSGRHQRACGAWSWFLHNPERFSGGHLGLALNVGSQERVKDLLKAKKITPSWEAGACHIDSE